MDTSKLILSVLLGAAAGAALGYYLASDDKEQLLEDWKKMAGKVKDELENEIEKGQQMVDDLKSKVNDLLHKA
jgi:hypothetical protein